MFADWLSYTVLGLGANTPLGASVDFFVYDTLKICILLYGITLLMSTLNLLFPIAKVRAYLTRNRLYGGEYVLASLLGTITPFCSCSSVPLFIGFVSGGIPLGVTLAFLISSPLVDGVVIAMLIGLFGMWVTVVYVVTGIVISAVAGYVLGKMKLERYLAAWIIELQQTHHEQATLATARTEPLVQAASREALAVLKMVAPYVLVGVGIGAAIHGYVPVGFFEHYLGGNAWWSVLLAVIIAVPLYASAAGVLPIAHALVAKGVAIGTVLAFMMAAVGLSIPSGLMLKKAMTWKLLGIFYAVVTLAIIFSGYFFNWVL